MADDWRTSCLATDRIARISYSQEYVLKYKQLTLQPFVSLPRVAEAMRLLLQQLAHSWIHLLYSVWFKLGVETRRVRNTKFVYVRSIRGTVTEREGRWTTLSQSVDIAGITITVKSVIAELVITICCIYNQKHLSVVHRSNNPVRHIMDNNLQNHSHYWHWCCYIMDDWIGTEKLQGDLPLAGDHVVRPDASGGDGAAAWSTQGCTDEAATAAAACGRGRWPQRSI